VTRDERVALARELHGVMAARDVADVLGVSIHTVRSYLSDPDLGKLRARKARYAGECVYCGKPTDGTSGKGRASERCVTCSVAHQKATARWTRESIITAIKAWQRRFGRPPRASEWRTRTKIRELGIRQPLEWPLTSTVQDVFGSWNAALEEAGVKTLKPGQYPRVRSIR
jgi:transposase